MFEGFHGLEDFLEVTSVDELFDASEFLSMGFLVCWHGFPSAYLHSKQSC